MLSKEQRITESCKCRILFFLDIENQKELILLDLSQDMALFQLFYVTKVVLEFRLRAFHSSRSNCVWGLELGEGQLQEHTKRRGKQIVRKENQGSKPAHLLSMCSFAQALCPPSNVLMNY